MIEPTKSSLIVVAISVFTVMALVSCGGQSATDTRVGPANTNAKAGEEQPTEVKLRKMLGSPLTIVVRDEKEMYWAIPSSGIAEINPTTPEGTVKVAIKRGTRLAGGSGHGDPTQIAEMLLEQMGPSGGPYFFSTKNKGQKDEVSISGQVGEAKANFTIEVKEVVLSKALQ